MSITEMTERLHFRGQAMVFASSLSSNKPFTLKEEVGFNFKKTSPNPNEKFTANKRKNKWIRCGSTPHFIRPCPALNKKCNNCEKVAHFSKMCRSKPQPNSSKYNKQINCFAKKKIFFQSKHGREYLVETFYLSMV